MSERRSLVPANEEARNLCLDHLQVSTDEFGVTLLRLNRPEARNALSPEMMEEIASELERIDPDPEIRCVVIAGSEDIFAAGADIRAMSERTFAEALRHPAASFWRRLAAIRTPMVAAVTGYALGGGCELALACDMIVASEDAQFGQPEITLGIIPGGGGTQRIARTVGKQRAMEYVLTGRRFDAPTALRMGLINKVTSKGNCLQEALELARTVAERPPIAVRLASRPCWQRRRRPSRRGSRTSAASTSWRWRPRTESRACRPSSRSESRSSRVSERGAVSVETVGVVGAGTMGAGIAAMACLGDYPTRIQDPDSDVLGRAEATVAEALAKGAGKAWSEEDAERASGLLSTVEALDALAGCDFIVEAAPERLDLKQGLFADLAEACGPETILASNTSSLRVTDIAARTPGPERVVGMHFFNPPTRMKLVEVVATADSSPEALVATTEVVERMRRTPIRAKDSPGFIANRLARPYSLESLRMLGDGVADAATIDRACRLGGGFRMGPFELIDLIGLDVNLSVARSFYEQGGQPERWRPSPIQEEMVEAGQLGARAARATTATATAATVPTTPTSDCRLRPSTRRTCSRASTRLRPRSSPASSPRSPTRPPSPSRRSAPPPT